MARILISVIWAIPWSWREPWRCPHAPIMIALSITLRSQADTHVEFLSAMKGLVARLRRTPGCIGCRLVTDCEAADTYSLLVQWNDRSAFEAFLGGRELTILQGMRLLFRDDPQAMIDEVSTRWRVSLSQARGITR